MIAQLAAHGTALLGEAPRWMSLAGGAPTLHFTDLLSGTVFSLVGDSAELTEQFDGETVSAIIPLTGGRTAIALHRSIAVLDRDGAIVRRIDLDLPDGARLSDGTAGPSGHIWLGVVPAGEQAIEGMLIRLEPGSFSVQRVDVGFSNGIGFTADGTAMLLIDSAINALWRIDHDPVTGELGASRKLFELAASEGTLDGLGLDEHDRTWIAVFGGGVVMCVDAEGAIVQRVSVPAPRTTSCVFGADRTLYVTTARIDAPVEELNEHPLAGSLFRVETDCLGGPLWEGQLA